MKSMPAGTDDGLESLYSQQEPEDNEGRQSVDQEEQEEMETSAVVPVKLLQSDGPPVKVGDEIVVKVKDLHGDEATIVYAPHKEGEEEGEGETETMDEGSGENDLESLNSGSY